MLLFCFMAKKGKGRFIQMFIIGFLKPSQRLIMSVSCVSGFPSGGVERVNPESQPLQPNYQASGAEVHPLPSSG